MSELPPHTLVADDAHVESTLERLIAAARQRFATEGFRGTSLDAIAADAGLTKEALHHHFESKADLFSDVFEDEHARIATRVAAASAPHEDPWEAAAAGLRAFLDASLEPEIQQIMLDAPSAIGLQAMRELEAPYGLALIKHALERAQRAGDLTDHDQESLARLLFGATCEAASFIARSEDQESAREKMELELASLLTSMRR